VIGNDDGTVREAAEGEDATGWAVVEGERDEVKGEEDRAFGELGDNDSWSGPDDAEVCAECGVRVQLEQMNTHTVDYRCPRCRRVFTRMRGAGARLVVGGVQTGEAPSARGDAGTSPAGAGKEQEDGGRPVLSLPMFDRALARMVITLTELASMAEVRAQDLGVDLSQSSPSGDEGKEGGSV